MRYRVGERQPYVGRGVRVNTIIHTNVRQNLTLKRIKANMEGAFAPNPF